MDGQLVGRAADLAEGLATVRAGRSVLVTGAAGVGKSRLLAELVGRLEPDHNVTSIVGHDSSRTIPFGAVAHLLDDEAPAHRGLLLASLRRAVTVGNHDRRAVLAVDDVDRVDDDTLSLVVSLASTGDAVVLATCRDDTRADDRLVGLWKDEPRAWLEVLPLDRGDAERLAADLLGGAPSRALAARLWEVARGNPLYVRELVLAGRLSGAVAAAGDYWDLVGTLSPGHRVADLVARRLSDLAPGPADALALVAVAEPVEVTLLAELAASEDLTVLEERRLLDVRDESAVSGQRSVAVVAHPLVGEVVRDSLGHFARRDLLRRVVAVVGRREDPRGLLRLATWLIELGEVPEPALALRAARVALARFDHAAAERLAATVTPGTTDSLVVLARARAGRGDVDQAVADLQRAVARADDDVDRTRATSAMIEVLGLVGGDLTRANQRLTDAIAATEDADRRRELRVRALVVAGLGGRFADALALAGELDTTSLARGVEAHGLMALTLAQSMTGRLADVEARLVRAATLAEDLRLAEPYLREQVGLNRVLVLQAAGRLRESLELVEGVLTHDGGDRHVAPWLFVGAVAAMQVGDLEQASTRTAESHALLVDSDPLGMRAMAAALAATIAGMRGRSVARWHAAAVEVGRPDEVRATAWLSLAEAWSRAWTGDVDTAAAVARSGGLEALAGEHLVWGAIVLHAAARMGRPAATAGTLNDLDAGPLVTLLADHATAAAARDPDHLAAVGAALEDHGARAVAADAWAVAAEIREPGTPVGARAAVRSHELADRCPGHRPFLLREMAVPITDRQREVGRLAAAGHESRRIADQLDIATKTVDNHLQRLYATLELAGRHELDVAFPFRPTAAG